LTPNLKPLMMAQNKFISQTSSDTHGWYTMTWEKPDGEKFTVKANIFGDIENDPLAKRTYKMHLEDLARREARRCKIGKMLIEEGVQHMEDLEDMSDDEHRYLDM